jgi:hydroxymethylbilane synthase
LTRSLRIGLRPGTLPQRQASRILALVAQAGVAAELIKLGPSLGTELLPDGIDLSALQFDEMPLHLPPSLTIAAVCPRAEPRDAWVSRDRIEWTLIPSGARVGVDGPCQQGQLLRARPDLRVECRDSIEGLLAGLRVDPGLAGVVVPMAALQLLEPGHSIGELLPLEVLVPAAGQGALALLTRDGDAAIIRVIAAAIHDPRAAACVRAERAFVAHLGAGRRDPVAALATWAEPGVRADGWLELVGRVVSSDGGLMVEGVVAEPVHGEAEAEQLGARLAEDLVAQGALELLAQS